MAHTFTTAHAVSCIRDYYDLKPHERAVGGKEPVAFERAKVEYISAMKVEIAKLNEQIARAESITIQHVFPKYKPD